jgi:hypothetical protein
VHHVDGGDIVNCSATSKADPIVERLCRGKRW